MKKKKKKTMKQCQQRVDNLKTKIKNKDQIINKKQDIITNAENYLGVNSLSNLPTMPTGKTLTDLITFYNNPPNCSHSTPQPIIITKTKQIPAEIIKEVEKPVIKIQETVKEVESEAQKKEIERLEGIVKDLHNAKKKIIVVYESDEGKIITIYSLVGVIIILGVAFAYLLRRKRKL